MQAHRHGILHNSDIVPEVNVWQSLRRRAYDEWLSPQRRHCEVEINGFSKGSYFQPEYPMSTQASCVGKCSRLLEVSFISDVISYPNRTPSYRRWQA